MTSFLYRKPVVGLLGLLIGFLTQPLGHTAYKMLESGFGRGVYVAAVVVGIVGFVIVWRGLRANELQATLSGLIGGWLIWIGWFEYAFKFFSVLYDVPAFPVEENGYAAAPQANMLQATVTIMFALFLLYGMFNLQTKCNFMRFFHRNLHFSPGMPTPDNQRSFARITAMEVLFVTSARAALVRKSLWACTCYGPFGRPTSSGSPRSRFAWRLPYATVSVPGSCCGAQPRCRRTSARTVSTGSTLSSIRSSMRWLPWSSSRHSCWQPAGRRLSLRRSRHPSATDVCGTVTGRSVCPPSRR